jgi:hypothetical protein
MLDIKIKGQSLRLFPESALSFEQYNALFQKEVGAEGFSYPIDIPTEENNIIFGFVENPQSTGYFKDYDCDLTIENSTRRAVFSILKASPSRYTCSIFIGLFPKKLLDKSLPELGLGGVRIIEDMIAHANSNLTETVDTADYTFFPIWNPHFYYISDTENAQGDFAGVINAYADNSFIPKSEIVDDNGTITVNTNTLVPFPYIVFVLKQIATLFNKNLTGSFIADADIKQLCIINTYDLMGQYPDYSNQIDLRNHVPDMTIRDFLNEIIIKFNIAINITSDSMSFNFKADALTELEDSNYTDVTEADPTLEPFVIKEVKGFTFSSEIDDNDSAIKEFAKYTVPDGRLTGIVTFKNQLPNPSVINEFYYVVYDNAFFKATISGGNHTTYEDVQGIKNAATYLVGDGGEKIESKSSTLMLQKHIPNVSEYPEIAGYGLCPNELVSGISVGLNFNTDKLNQFPLKFLFYRGLQPNYDNQMVPLGTNDVWNAQNQKVGNLTLQWYGTYGLYERLHKRWVLKLESAKAINYNIVFKSEHLANINFFKPKRIDNQRILIEKINYAITPDGIQKATARTVKI